MLSLYKNQRNKTFEIDKLRVQDPDDKWTGG